MRDFLRLSSLNLPGIAISVFAGYFNYSRVQRTSLVGVASTRLTVVAGQKYHNFEVLIKQASVLILRTEPAICEERRSQPSGINLLLRLCSSDSLDGSYVSCQKIGLNLSMYFLTS